MKQTGKSIGKVLLGALILAAVLAVIAGITAMLTDSGFLDVMWRLCSGAGGIVLLAGAVLLLTHRSTGKTRMKFWEAHFPGLNFTAAVILVGVILVLLAGLMNALVF